MKINIIFLGFFKFWKRLLSLLGKTTSELKFMVNSRLNFFMLLYLHFYERKKIDLWPPKLDRFGDFLSDICLATFVTRPLWRINFIFSLRFLQLIYLYLFTGSINEMLRNFSSTFFKHYIVIGFFYLCILAGQNQLFLILFKKILYVWTFLM